MNPDLLTIHVDVHQFTAGVSLQGSLCYPAEAVQLQQALAPLIRNANVRHIWLDCQHLQHLSRQGQRAMLVLDQQARQASTTLHWCGLSEEIINQLTESGLYLLLQVLPAGGYQGPAISAQPQPANPS